MATTYTTHAALAKIADADTDWGSEQRPVMDVLDRIVSGDERTYYVAPNFSQANIYPQSVPSVANRRFFNSIQAAIDSAEANAATYDSSGGSQIFVYPGTYNENLTIRRNITLHAVGGVGPFFYPGARVYVRGDGSTAPAITIQMSNGTTHYVSVHGIVFDNNADPGATEVTSVPYAIELKDKEILDSYGPNVNIYGFHNCTFRMQTWGANSKWEMGNRLRYFGDAYFKGCQFTGLNFGGTFYNGYIRRLFDFAGPGSGNRLVARFDDCKFYQDETTGPPPSDQTVFYQGNYSQIYLHRSTVSMVSTDARVQYGALGLVSHGFPGDPFTDAALHNIFNYSAVMT